MRVRGDWCFTRMAAVTTVVESGADGMLKGTGQAVMRLDTSLLSGMGRWRGFARRSQWPPEVDMLVQSDSTAALQAVVRAACNGRGRTRDLVEVVDEVGRGGQMGLSTQFVWVKAHVGIDGNERADLMVKVGYRESLLPQVTEGRVRAYRKGVSSRERAQQGLGSGRMVR